MSRRQGQFQDRSPKVELSHALNCSDKPVFHGAAGALPGLAPHRTARRSLSIVWSPGCFACLPVIRPS